MSGFDSDSRVVVTDYSHYGKNTQDNLTYGSLNYSKVLNLSDGIYAVNVNATDIATNTNSDSSEKYLIDGTKPTISFNVPSGIFSDKNGAVRKASQKGSNDAFYGKITAKDNLSGVAKIQYEWTVGNTSPKDYEIIYTSPYTYTDRYQETIEKEIEKPVGDNLYLHVQIWDTANNMMEQVFGPFEDPIKLKNFEVTEVTDPAWQNVFWKDLKNRVATGTTYSTDKLPIDESSHPTYKTGALPKKGYAFKFDITSEYLYRNYDEIEILPTFYYYDGSSRIPVDLYYNYDNNPFILMGSPQDKLQVSLPIQYKPLIGINIGQLNKIILKKDVRIVKDREWDKKEKTEKYVERPWYLGQYYTLAKGETYSTGWKDEIQYIAGKEQWWYGTYYIPPNAVFTKKGDMPYTIGNILDKNKIIVNFQITGSKNRISNETLTDPRYFTYVPEQWKNEKGPKSGIYEPGDVMVYDNYRTALMDYEMRITQ